MSKPLLHSIKPLSTRWIIACQENRSNVIDLFH